MGGKWSSIPLGDVVELKRGFDLPRQDREDGPYPVYSSSGITGCHSVPAVGGPCVITGRYGTLGEVFYSSGPCWPLNTSLFATDFKGNSPRFVYYLLKNFPWQEFTTASAVPGINRNHINGHLVNIPDYATQQEIVSVLGALDDKIALNTRMNGCLEELLDAIAAEESCGMHVPLERLCIQVNDKTSYTNASIESYVTTDSMVPNRGGIIRPVKLPASGKVTCYMRGDILVSNIRPYFKKIWYADAEGTCSGDIVVFRALDSDKAPYLYSMLRQDDFFDYVMSGAKGTKMPRGDKRHMMRYELPGGCSESSLSLLGSLLEQVSDNRRESSRLAAIRDALLPKLMSGEIDVSEVEHAWL